MISLSIVRALDKHEAPCSCVHDESQSARTLERSSKGLFAFLAASRRAEWWKRARLCIEPHCAKTGLAVTLQASCPGCQRGTGIGAGRVVIATPALTESLPFRCSRLGGFVLVNAQADAQRSVLWVNYEIPQGARKAGDQHRPPTQSLKAGRSGDPDHPCQTYGLNTARQQAL